MKTYAGWDAAVVCSVLDLSSLAREMEETCFRLKQYAYGYAVLFVVHEEALSYYR